MVDSTRRRAVWRLTQPLSALGRILLSSIQSTQRSMQLCALARVCVAGFVSNAPVPVLLVGIISFQRSKIYATGRHDSSIKTITRAGAVDSDDHRVYIARIPATGTRTLRLNGASNVCETFYTNDCEILSIITRLVVFFTGEAAAWRIGVVGKVVMMRIVGVTFAVKLVAFHAEILSVSLCAAETTLEVLVSARILGRGRDIHERPPGELAALS